MSTKELLLVGTRNKGASVEARERYEARVVELLPQLRRPRLEMARLATCNRVEVYVAGQAHDLQHPFLVGGPGLYRKWGRRRGRAPHSRGCGKGASP